MALTGKAKLLCKAGFITAICNDTEIRLAKPPSFLAEIELTNTGNFSYRKAVGSWNSPDSTNGPKPKSVEICIVMYGM